MRRLHPAGIEPADASDGVTPVADGIYAQRVEGGRVLGYAEIEIDTPLLLALTTSINGVPDFVWDADNQLVYTEVPS